MYRARVAITAACLSALTGGCERPASHYDRGTPDKALESFFAALGRGRLPRDLDAFIADTSELEMWRFRCRSKGCVGGHYRVDDREVHERRALLHVTYAVTGRAGGKVLSGRRSPVRLVRDGDRWMFLQFGERVERALRPAPVEAVPADAGAHGPPAAPGAG